jgi:hypothetical protein
MSAESLNDRVQGYKKISSIKSFEYFGHRSIKTSYDFHPQLIKF